MSTKFLVEIASALPSGGNLVRLISNPDNVPPLSFSKNQVDSATYPSSGSPSQGDFGVGGIHVSSWSIDANYDTDRVIWTAPAACQLVKVVFNQTVIEATGNSSTVLARKVASGQAIGTGVALFTGGTPLNLKTGVVANTPLIQGLTATAADLIFAAGDWLGLDFTNALTEYVGCADFYFNWV